MLELSQTRRRALTEAERGLIAAKESFDGNLKGLGETVRSGNQLQLIIRPQEVTAALRQLLQSYLNYYASVNEYNQGTISTLSRAWISSPERGGQ